MFAPPFFVVGSQIKLPPHGRKPASAKAVLDHVATQAKPAAFLAYRQAGFTPDLISWQL